MNEFNSIDASATLNQQQNTLNTLAFGRLNLLYYQKDESGVLNIGYFEQAANAGREVKLVEFQGNQPPAPPGFQLLNAGVENLYAEGKLTNVAVFVTV
jgi:hypothetical protein